MESGKEQNILESSVMCIYVQYIPYQKLTEDSRLICVCTIHSITVCIEIANVHIIVNLAFSQNFVGQVNLEQGEYPGYLQTLCKTCKQLLCNRFLNRSCIMLFVYLLSQCPEWLRRQQNFLVGECNHIWLRRWQNILEYEIYLYIKRMKVSQFFRVYYHRAR